MKVARFGVKCVGKLPLYTSQRGLIRPPAWVTGFLTKKDKRPAEVHHWEEKNFNERLEDLFPRDQDLETVHNIGEEPGRNKISPKEKRAKIRENSKNQELERSSRLRKLQVPLDDVKSDWLEEYGVEHQYQIACHYGIYDHLFNGAYFLPVVQLNVGYEYDDEFVTPVYKGNFIGPSEASMEPYIDYEAEEGSLWTLVLTNPDGHLTDPEGEYLHWMVGNIPGNDIGQGELLADYLPPFPVHGTGPHRMVFLLFRQEGQMDLSQYKLSPKCTNLSERTFSTSNLYKQHEEQLTPVGLAFFQTEWEESVRDTFHHVLDMGEPRYEFKHPVPYHPPQAKYPYKQPFDRFYDRYRDKKDLAEEVLRMKLENVSPFERPQPPPKYPLIHREKTYKPSWLKNREELMHRRIEQFKDLN